MEPSCNLPPDKPDTPWKKIKPTQSSTYSTRTTDPDNDQVYYLWDWDDGTNSDWLGPFNSGDLASATHIWSEAGQFSIKVKAKDEFDAESPWSNPLKVTIPRAKTSFYNPIECFFSLFSQMFPISRTKLRNHPYFESSLLRFLDMFPVLQRILRLLI